MNNEHLDRIIIQANQLENANCAFNYSSKLDQLFNYIDRAAEEITNKEKTLKAIINQANHTRDADRGFIYSSRLDQLFALISQAANTMRTT